MAALGALVKKAWSVRRAVVLLGAPLALLPVLLSLPAKVPRGRRAAAGAGQGSVGHRAGRGARSRGVHVVRGGASWGRGEILGAGRTVLMWASGSCKEPTVLYSERFCEMSVFCRRGIKSLLEGLGFGT